MREHLRAVDRFAGRVYTRILALLTGVVALGMLMAGIVAWALAGVASAWIWLLGALVFGVIARLSWRSRAQLSDVDFTV